MSNNRSIDRLLFNEYALIPQGERPLVGSNDWFRWLEEFQQRHPIEVSRLTQSLAERARQVLWPPDKQGLGSLVQHSGPSEKPTTEDLKKKLEELGRREKRLRTQQRELDSVKREMKSRYSLERPSSLELNCAFCQIETRQAKIRTITT